MIIAIIHYILYYNGREHILGIITHTVCNRIIPLLFRRQTQTLTSRMPPTDLSLRISPQRNHTFGLSLSSSPSRSQTMAPIDLSLRTSPSRAQTMAPLDLSLRTSPHRTQMPTIINTTNPFLRDSPPILPTKVSPPIFNPR